jgi:hypothetical protein
LKVADIVIADKDINVGADITAFVEQMFFEIGEIQCQLLYGAVNGTGANLQPGCIIGELPQGSGNDDCCHVIGSFFVLFM